MITVIKRDGVVQSFDPSKIIGAIRKAFNEVDGEITEEAKVISVNIAEKISEIEKELSVEEIQDIVEQMLMDSNRKDVAKAYIIYRNERSERRELRSGIRSKIREKLKPESDDRQNANVDGKSFGGMVGAVTSEVMREVALTEIMSETAKNNHVNNEVYTHDLDSYPSGMHNCLTIFEDFILKNGFNTRQTDVRGAKSFSTKTQLDAVIDQLQSLQQFGGVSYSHFDHSSVPYVRHSFNKHYRDVVDIIPFAKMPKIDNASELSVGSKIYSGNWYNFLKRYISKKALKLTEREVYQAIEGLYHNLNLLGRLNRNIGNIAI